ncbi:dual OB domain-containing protein [Parasedimentitalea psychrophila]|uniref:Dual OB-containing domain-containing protein n=1 Tax=Parasedimentitalea psychrophila TaxID=2997337 RepID=A0A9Y2L479_9RHOB|nr:hypothetical protein [Parasedimentitalea psychrophila]WIY27381.1 hypothetical protein QPJ95_10970 [Parasedimentitalea psychrophila]
MTYKNTFVCIANSTKHLGRCIAGIKIVENQYAGWVRPVSERPGREISEEDRLFENGQKCSVLDIVEVPMERHEPFLHQNENHVINGELYWKKIGVMPAAHLLPAVQNFDEPIWPHCESTRYGQNDKIDQNRLVDIDTSLALIQPESVEIVVSTDPGFNGAPGRVAVRANFICGGQANSLKITDPLVKADYMGRGQGTYEIQQPLLVVSLAEPWVEQPYAFKVVASVLMP